MRWRRLNERQTNVFRAGVVTPRYHGERGSPAFWLQTWGSHPGRALWAHVTPGPSRGLSAVKLPAQGQLPTRCGLQGLLGRNLQSQEEEGPGLQGSWPLLAAKPDGGHPQCPLLCLPPGPGIVRASSVFPILSTILLLLGGLCIGAGRFYSRKNNIVLSAGILFVAAGESRVCSARPGCASRGARGGESDPKSLFLMDFKHLGGGRLLNRHKGLLSGVVNLFRN